MTRDKAVGNVDAALILMPNWLKEHLAMNSKKNQSMLIVSQDREKAHRLNSIFNWRICSTSGSEIQPPSYLGGAVQFHIKEYELQHRLTESSTAGLSIEQRVSGYHAFIELNIIYCSPVWSAATVKLR